MLLEQIKNFFLMLFIRKFIYILLIWMPFMLNSIKFDCSNQTENSSGDFHTFSLIIGITVTFFHPTDSCF